MKRILLLLIISVFALGAYSQQPDVESYYRGIESYKDLHLSSDQIARIKKLKREKGPRFAAIGRDRSLSGYEKGQRKRELAMKYRQEIRSILTENQSDMWENRYGKWSSEYSMKDVVSDDFDDALDALERKYDAEEDAIENNYHLSKDQRKAQKKALKASYKAEKEALKARKKAAKNNF